MTAQFKFATREEWLNAAVTYLRPEFLARGYSLPDRIRVSVGFTSGGRRSKRIGECWSDAASADQYFEIFLRPSVLTDARILDILTHELCHAAVGIDAGHGATFGACARSLGLEGKLTSTHAGEQWYKWALPVLTELGPMPYGVLNEGAIHTGKPKQKTNLRKIECPACGWLARVTLKHIEAHEHLNCPVPDCVGVLVLAD